MNEQKKVQSAERCLCLLYRGHGINCVDEANVDYSFQGKCKINL